MATKAPAAKTVELPESVHFLNRLSFGPTRAALAQVDELGWQHVLEAQLDHHNIDTTDIDNTISNVTSTLDLSPQEIAYMDDPEVRQQLVPDLIGSSMLRQIYSPAQLYERMVEFWSDHFSVDVRENNIDIFKASDDRDAIRPHALATFRELLHANARSPAMLLYLDNYSNSKSGPNENYARELMELHTLGVSGGYTEEDVVEVARAFTGWTIDRDTLEFKFSVVNHDWGKKVVLGSTITNANAGGIKDGEAVLDLLASHPSTARFICSKLIRRFVSDAEHPQLLKQMSAVFSETDGNIKELLRVIFHSNSFWTNRETKMKRPLDLMVSAIRRFDIPADEEVIRYVYYRLKEMGQAPFSWHAPNGYPDTAGYWTNTAALASRWNTGAETANFLPDEYYQVALSGAKTPNTIIQNMAVALIDRKLGDDDRAAFKQEIFVALLPNKVVPGNPVAYARLVTVGLLASRYFQMR